MQLAISGTELHEKEPLNLLMEGAKQTAITSLELWYPKNVASEGIDNSLRRIKEAGLEIVCVSSGSELYRKGGSPADQKLLIKAIELAGRLGAAYANTYFGYADVVDDHKAIKAYAAALKPCLKIARDQGVTIVLENEFNAFGLDSKGSDITRRPTSLIKLFETVDDPRFGLNFDAANFYCAGVEPYPYAYFLLKPYIRHMHVKDCGHYKPEVANPIDLSRWRRFTDIGREYSTMPLGEGAVPWPALLREIHQNGYRGFLTLEPHSVDSYRLNAWSQAARFVRRQLIEGAIEPGQC